MNFNKTEIKVRGDVNHKQAIIYRQDKMMVIVNVELKSHDVKILDVGIDGNTPTIMMRRDGCQNSFIQFPEFSDWEIHCHQIVGKELRIVLIKVEE